MSYRRQARDRSQYYFLRQINLSREQGKPEEVRKACEEFLQDQATQRIVNGVNNALSAVAQGYNQRKNRPD